MVDRGNVEPSLIRLDMAPFQHTDRNHDIIDVWIIFEIQLHVPRHHSNLWLEIQNADPGTIGKTVTNYNIKNYL